eukprot:8216640-Alexandrium_andersonii.AAC.1
MFEYNSWIQETAARCLAVVDRWRRGLPVGHYFGNAGGACRAPFASGSASAGHRLADLPRRPARAIDWRGADSEDWLSH